MTNSILYTYGLVLYMYGLVNIPGRRYNQYIFIRPQPSIHAKEDGGPPEKINHENLKFGLKFMVLAHITSRRVGLSSRNFSRRRAARQG